MSVPSTLLGLIEPEPSHGYELKQALFGGRARKAGNALFTSRPICAGSN